MQDSKSREDWILAAITALDDGGIDAVRVEPIAKGLGVTKGSFYWHFTDRPDLLEAVLVEWETGTRELIARVRGGTSPRDRVLGLFAGLWRPVRGPLDSGVFAWASVDGEVARRVAAVESRRIEFVREQLSGAGLEGGEAGRRSHVAYLTMMGWIERANRAHAGADPRVFASYVFDLVVRHLEGSGRNIRVELSGGAL